MLYFQSVQTDMEDRALYLSNRPKVFESVYRDDDLTEASRMHKVCFYWASELMNEYLTTPQQENYNRKGKERNVLFNYALNTFIYSYMASDIC